MEKEAQEVKGETETGQGLTMAVIEGLRHDHDHDDHLHAENRFSFGQFFFWTGVQLAAALGLFALIAPQQFRAETSQGWLILGWVLLLGLPISLFEYIYHRYLLHSSILPFLGLMHKCHSEHHGLTNVKAPVLKSEPETMVPVTSKYPIEEEHQEESMQFPLFAISIFYLVFMLLLGLPIKAIFPSQPVIFSTLITVTLAYGLYEFWHALLHLPFERYWKPLMEKRRIGKVTRHVYAFHLMHHWRPTTNLAVVGFWGWAVWDHLFRTHHRPFHMPLNQARVNYHDADIPSPRWPISLVDKMQPKLYKTSRKIEQGLARLFKRSG